MKNIWVAVALIVGLAFGHFEREIRSAISSAVEIAIYFKQQERGRLYSAKDVPTEWDEGNVEAARTRIEFFSEPE